MVRLFNTYFPGRILILGASEMILISFAFIAALVIGVGRDADLVLSYEGGLQKVLIITAVFLVCMYYLDLYDSMVITNRREVLTRLVQVAGMGSLVLGGLYFVYPDLRLATNVFLIGVTLLLIALSFGRELFYVACRSEHFAQRAIIIGDGSFAWELAGELEKRPESGIKVLGYVTSKPTAENGTSLPRLGGLDSLTEVVGEQRIEHIIVALQDRRGKLPIEQLLAVKTEGVQVTDSAELYEALTGKLQLSSLRLSTLLFCEGFRVSPKLLIYKRMFSILIAGVLLVLCAPLMLLVAIAIRLDSPGPALFRQRRVGKHRKIFTLYKFRSMRNGSESLGNQPATSHDARFTRVGGWLRRTRLDELPQLYNIVKGDMYFVGPRPFVPSQEQECVEKIPFYSQRWSVRPGATGWAQVNRDYCATLEDNAEKLAYDLFYIKHISVGLDLFVLFKTVKILLLGRGGR